MSRIINDKELLLGTAVFLLLYSIDENEVRGKRVRKKITRAIKAKLAERRNEDPKSYLELVNKGADILEKTKQRYHAAGNVELSVSPGAMLGILNFRYHDDFSIFNILPRDMKTLMKAYENVGITFISIKYTNFLVKIVYEELGLEYPECGDSYVENI